MNRPTPEFLSGLIKGQRLIVDNGAAGRVMGRVADITPKLIIVRMGTEKRRFLRADRHDVDLGIHSDCYVDDLISCEKRLRQ